MQRSLPARTWVLGLLLAVGAATGCFESTSVPQQNLTDPRMSTAPVTNFNPRWAVPAEMKFPAITAQEMEVGKPEDQKAQRMLLDHDLVLGVVVNNEARAYPINGLTGPAREIYNDQLGGRAIAATW